LGQGHQRRLRQYQRQGGGDREQAGFPQGVRAPALSCAGRQFYEWKKTGTGKQPYAIALADRGIMALAGLWENWHSPAGEWIRSFAIITTQPNELCAELHNRMPVILKPEAWPAWLGEEPATVRDLKDMLAPYPSDDMISWPVSTRVGNVKNNDPTLIEPIAAA
jgi:putative SOS response-associated peptidase YedK